MPNFTPTQGRYLSFILAYTEGLGLPPAESEIADALKVSPPSVNQMMKMLEKKGLIQRQAGVARSIEILIDRSEIPKWTGKRITRTVTGWVSTKPRVTKTELVQQSRSIQTVYQFKISLRGIKPLIWRRIETLDVTLAKFHEAIQTAMGWTNSHLHAFEVGRVRYTDPRMLDDVFPDPFEKSYGTMKISDLIKKHGPKLRLIYMYDFGDGWEHDVLLEKTTTRQPAKCYPRCLSGKRNCPPEDVGGIYGYEHFLDALGKPDDEEHDDFVEWAGEFDAEAFDLDDTNEAMRVGLPSW
jgi:hypothetical protein